MQYFFQKKEILPLVFFRILFGFLGFSEVLIYYYKYNYFHDYYINPSFHFKYWGFEWVPNISPGIFPYILILLCLSYVFIAFGFLYIFSSILSFILFAWIFFMESSSFLNHWYFYLLIHFLMIFFNANQKYSIDTYFKISKKSNSTYAYTYFMIQFQIFIAVFYSGIVKLNSDWLSGNTIETLYDFFKANDLMQLYKKMGGIYTEKIIAYGTIVMEIAFPWLLFYKKSRWIAFIVLSLFLLQNAYILHIGTFPYISIVCLSMFFVEISGKKNTKNTINFRNKIIGYLLGLYIIFQLVFPLKIFLYKDYVWQGYSKTNFSWNMFLGIPTGHISYLACDRKDNYIKIDPLNYGVTMAQKKKMIYNTQHITQFGKFLCHKYPDKKIFVNSFLSVNHRSLQPYFKPNVDLCNHIIENNPHIMEYKKNVK